MTLSLGSRQIFIAAVLLCVSFPCVTTFVVLLKELGIKDFIKSTVLMIATCLIVGITLNLFIPK